MKVISSQLVKDCYFNLKLDNGESILLNCNLNHDGELKAGDDWIEKQTTINTIEDFVSNGISPKYENTDVSIDNDMAEFYLCSLTIEHLNKLYKIYPDNDLLYEDEDNYENDWWLQFAIFGADCDNLSNLNPDTPFQDYVDAVENYLKQIF